MNERKGEERDKEIMEGRGEIQRDNGREKRDTKR